MAKITTHDKLDVALDNLIAKVEEAGSWIKPFKSAIQSGMPMNAKGVEYKGINVFILWATAMEKGYTSNKWYTYKGAKEKGIQVKKGEKSTTIFFFKPIQVTDKDNIEEGATKIIFMLKSYNVFNTDQTDMEIEKIEDTEVNENEVIESAKEFFDNLDYLEVVKHPQPHYDPSTDMIGMPSINDFDDSVNFYATLAHEHTHATGIKTRCNRKDFYSTKREDYAFEELVAEIGSIFVMAHLGIDGEPIQDNSAAYLKSWLKALKNDKKYLWKASNQATKAYEFMLENQYQTVAENTLELA